MAGQGLIPGRGPWTVRQFNTTSTATYLRNCAVAFSANLGTVSEYSGGASGFLGIALSGSTYSLPAGKVQVAIPNGPECTLFADVPVIGGSLLTVGATCGIYKVGNLNSWVTMSYTSSAGRPFIIVSPLNSANSTIELAVEYASVTYGSAGSQAYL